MTTLNPNTLHNLTDQQIFEELKRRFPEYVFAGQDMKGTVMPLFSGSMLKLTGLARYVGHAVELYFDALEAQNRERQAKGILDC